MKFAYAERAYLLQNLDGASYIDTLVRCVLYIVRYYWHTVTVVHFAFSALTLLIGRQEEHAACKN